MGCLDPHLEQPAGVRLSLYSRVPLQHMYDIQSEGVVMETSDLCSIIHGSLASHIDASKGKNTQLAILKRIRRWLQAFVPDAWCFSPYNFYLERR